MKKDNIYDSYFLEVSEKEKINKVKEKSINLKLFGSFKSYKTINKVYK